MSKFDMYAWSFNGFEYAVHVRGQDHQEYDGIDSYNTCFDGVRPKQAHGQYKSLALYPVDGGGVLFGFKTEDEADEYAKITGGERVNMDDTDDARQIYEIQYLLDFARWNKKDFEQVKAQFPKEWNNWTQYVGRVGKEHAAAMMKRFAK